MLVAIVFGGYTLFFSSASETEPTSTAKEVEDLNRLVTDVAESLSKKNLSRTTTHIMTLAVSEWIQDPFLRSESSSHQLIRK